MQTRGASRDLSSRMASAGLAPIMLTSTVLDVMTGLSVSSARKVTLVSIRSASAVKVDLVETARLARLEDAVSAPKVSS